MGNGTGPRREDPSLGCFYDVRGRGVTFSGRITSTSGCRNSLQSVTFDSGVRITGPMNDWLFVEPLTARHILPMKPANPPRGVE